MSKTGKKKDETYNSYSDDDNFNVANADGQKKKKGKYTYSNAFDYGERTSMAFDSQMQQKQAQMTREDVAF